MKWRMKLNAVDAVRYENGGIVSSKGAVISVERWWWLVSGPKGARSAMTDEEFAAGFEVIGEEHSKREEGESVE